MSVVGEDNLSEESPVQTRKTDRMLTKILQKLHRFSPPDDQRVGKDVAVEEREINLSNSAVSGKVG